MRIFLLISLFFLLLGCSNNQENRIIIKGDDLGEIIFNEFVNSFGELKLEFKGGGAQSGIFAMMDRTVDAVFSLKELSNEDYALLNSKKIYVKTIPLIKVPVVFVINSKNPINSLSLVDIKSIYNGYIKYWWQLGDRRERALIRNNPLFGTIEYCSVDRRNGEYYSVKSSLGIADFYLDVKFFPHSKPLQDYVRNSENGIGFFLIPFFSGIEEKYVKIVNQDIEVTGYLIVRESLYKTESFYNFFQSLKSFLLEKKSLFLNMGIKIIIDSYNF